jgi:hypothetical protein
MRRVHASRLAPQAAVDLAGEMRNNPPTERGSSLAKPSGGASGSLMNVICDTCKLTLTVRDQDRGRTHTCPVCRGVLREESVKPPTTETPITWPGHDLSEAVALVNGAALSAILDVESPQGWGEIQLIAGGIHRASCVHNDKTLTGEDAITVMTSWRPDIHIRSRLPSLAGELDQAGPDTGDLAERPLAAVMRYCEDFVLTCAVVAWRGNETAHVYYRRGGIERTLVNGVDDAARLPEVMAWKAGRYRILLPKLELPEAVPEAAPAEGAPSTTMPGMATIPGMETPAPPTASTSAPQIVTEAPKPAPAAEFSPATLPKRPAMTIIGMPAVIVPPVAAPPAAAPPAAAPPAAAPPAAAPPAARTTSPRDAHTTIPIVTQERPTVETKRSMPIEIMDAPDSPPRPSTPAMQAAPPAAAPQPATPEPVASRPTQRGAAAMADPAQPAPAPAPAAPAPAPAPAAAAPAAPAPAAAPAKPAPVAPAPAAPAPAAAAPAAKPPAAVAPVATPAKPAPAPAPAALAPAPKPAEPRVSEPRISEPPMPRKRPWVVPLFIVAFVAVAVAAFFIARMIWPAGPTP